MVMKVRAQGGTPTHESGMQSGTPCERMVHGMVGSPCRGPAMRVLVVFHLCLLRRIPREILVMRIRRYAADSSFAVWSQPYVSALLKRTLPTSPPNFQFER